MSISGAIKAGQPGTRRLSEDAIAALQSGDIDALLRIEHSEFGRSRMMADGDDDDDDDDDDGPDGGDGDGSDDDDDDEGKTKKKDKKDDDDDDSLERMRRRMKAADKRADAAEKELRKKQDAEKGDLEKATERVTELETENGSLKESVNSLRLENAFLTTNKFTWHDPESALALAQSKGFLEDVVDEDGEVDKKALGKALERLSKDHAYLVKTEKKEDKSDSGPSGEPAGGRSDNGKDDKAKAQARARRFPVLNR